MNEVNTFETEKKEKLNEFNLEQMWNSLIGASFEDQCDWLDLISLSLPLEKKQTIDIFIRLACLDLLTEGDKGSLSELATTGWEAAQDVYAKWLAYGSYNKSHYEELLILALLPTVDIYSHFRKNVKDLLTEGQFLLINNQSFSLSDRFEHAEEILDILEIYNWDLETLPFNFFNDYFGINHPLTDKQELINEWKRNMKFC